MKLVAENLYKTYRLGRLDVPVLRGVSLSVMPGEFVAVLGQSGSGKSTLLHLLGGLDRPDTSNPEMKPGGLPFISFGDIQIAGGGSLASNFTLDRYRNRQVGFVFQFYHLLPELTVLENTLIPAMVRYGRISYLAKRAALRKRAEELLGAFGLSHRLRHRPKELSGGERQRVAIARALINDPPLLLADEPTGNLDRKTGDSILNELLEHRKVSGRSVLMVTHDLEVASRADRVVRLVDGRLASGQG